MNRDDVDGAVTGTHGGGGVISGEDAGTGPDLGIFFDASPNAYMVLDSDLRFVAANPAYLRSVGGVSREAIIGRHLFEAFPSDPDDPDDEGVRQVRESLQRVLASGKADHLALIPYTIAYHSEAGVVNERRYWSATHTPIRDEEGRVRFILQHTVDVTDLQETKQALRDARDALSERVPLAQIEQGVLRRAQLVQEANQTLQTERRRLRQLFEQAPGFVAVLVGPNHVFTLINDAYTQLVGHREVIGKSAREALPEIEGQGLFDLLDHVFATGEPAVGRGRRLLLQRTSDGPLEELYVDFVFQPISEPDGDVVGTFVQGHDVTDQVRAQEKLRHLNDTLEQRVEQRTRELEARNRELQEFAYVASHDLQEPLRKIHSFADLLVADYVDRLDGDARSYLDRMRHAARRMSALIADLLAFSRVETRGEVFRQTALATIAEEVLLDLEESVREAGADVVIGDLPTVQADATQMRQLLQNLLSNALKYRRTDVKPHIEMRSRIEAGRPGPILHLEVEDNGIGFDAKYLDRIFSPFQRLHGRTKYGGTGMGLAICRRIVERHEGSISARSTPGSGSVFVVRLPVEQHSRDG